jgi:hypothetical protein
MSIVAMKRKSRVANKAISSYGEGFSLNGGRRSQGWVGQSSLGRGLNGTRFRGPNPMAVGKLGTNSVVNSGRCSANDPSIIKRSTMNNGRVVRGASSANEHCTAANSHDSMFNSDLTNTEIDTKIKTLDKFKLESISNQYMEVVRVDPVNNQTGGSVTFERPFDQTPDVIVQIINNSETSLQTYTIDNVTKNGFDYLGRRWTGSSVNNTASDFFYMAVGNR